MRYIKSFLTGTTLVVASTTGIMADPPNGIKLIDKAKIKHPVFGTMKVISHKEDLDFYLKDPNKSLFENEYDEGVLAENFIKYVLNTDSLQQANIPQKDMEKFVVKTCNSQAGMATLKVITANYMREYDRIKQFCKDHQAELKACYDFSQTENGKALYEKERQIFELEEKLKNLLWNAPSEKLESYFSKSGISSDDLKNLYRYFRKEEEVFNNELKESWTQLQKEDSEGFFIGEKDYEPFCKLYEHFFKKNDDESDDDSDNDLVIHCRGIKQDSERYKKLQNFVTDHKIGFEKFFNIGDLRLCANPVERGSVTEWHCRIYYSKCKVDLERLLQLRQEEAELLETAKSVTKIESLIASQKRLGKLYKDETEEENKKKFSCIRRSVIPPCYFPILYRHFFVENDSEYSVLKRVNKFLYRTLKFKDAEKGCSFDWRTLSVIGNWDEAEEIQNYYVNDQNKFLDCDDKNQTTPLQHELMHFMDAVYDLNRLKVCEKISKELTDIIETNGTVCELEILNVKPKKSCSDSEEEDSEEEEDCSDRRTTELLRKLYDNGGEMWTMYGICICKDDQNPGKYMLYYDPINEAVANEEALQIVRTGHARFKNKNHIDSDDEENPPSEIKVLKALDEKICIYNFYFSEGETLRKLIHM